MRYEKIFGIGVGTILFFVSGLAQTLKADETTPQPHAHHHGSELPSGEITDDSLYQTESLWQTSDSKTVKLSSFRGTPQVIALFYASCESACPIIVDLMKQVERQIGAEALSKTHFILVTFDPERDSTETLRAYAVKRSLTAPGWTLLRGSPEDTQELAVLLGFKYKKLEDGNFAHSNTISVLDKNGRIAYQMIGLQSGIAGIVKALKKELS